jgi:hypothetical protein
MISHDVSNKYLHGLAIENQRRHRATKALCPASQAGCFRVRGLSIYGTGYSALKTQNRTPPPGTGRQGP